MRYTIGWLNLVRIVSCFLSPWKNAIVTRFGYLFYNNTVFGQDLSSWCLSYFNSEPFYLKALANNTWADDASKQPDWDGAACP
tara:strand:+ start:1675 stop:1923 length:249 start_codon:yes stop_codon:yes gene_type:complete